jgi:hypothetical protein
MSRGVHHNDLLIIFEKLISINEYNFRLTNIEAARTIISTLKSLMEIPFFNGDTFPNILNGNL